MVLSYWLLQPFYRGAWRLQQMRGHILPAVFYCGSPLDWTIFAPVQKYLRPMPVVTDKPEVVRYFRANGGGEVRRLPAFPDAVVMCRHACHKFPHKDIVKIGMRHGPYHFKRMTSAANYNRFDLYLMSSAADLEAAKSNGVRSGRAVGYPKLAPAFNGELGKNELNALRERWALDPHRKTLLFTATWPGSGMSAFAQWQGHLGEFTGDYNILVTLHPWFTPQERALVTAVPGVRLLAETDVLPAIMLADVCIGDTSSILAECCALDKPLVTWRVPGAKRSLVEIDNLLDGISLRVENISQMSGAIFFCLADPGQLHNERMVANRLMFDQLDGHAGERAAAEIARRIPRLRLATPQDDLYD